LVHGKAAVQMIPGGDLAYYLSEPGADAPSPAVIQGEETSKYKHCDAYPRSRGFNRNNLAVRLRMDSRYGVGFDAVYLRL
jgi:hypothetical protein